MKRFHGFCVKYDIQNPFPVTEHLLCCFAAFLADEGLAPQTGKAYLAALRNMQLSLGFPDPRDQSSLPILKRVQAGIRRVRMLKGSAAKIRLPITAPILHRIRDTLDASACPHKVALWAVAAVAFFGFFRLGELLPEKEASGGQTPFPLTFSDVAVDRNDSPRMIRIHLSRSKCDQFGNGADIFLGRIDSPICPVAALLGFLAARGSGSGPLFRRVDGRVITKVWFVEQLRVVLESVGLPQHQYAGHSFRIGAATTAALAGVEDSTIQALGRWSSAAFLQYIRMPREQLASLTAVMARVPHPPDCPRDHPRGQPDRVTVSVCVSQLVLAPRARCVFVCCHPTLSYRLINCPGLARGLGHSHGAGAGSFFPTCTLCPGGARPL